MHYCYWSRTMFYSYIASVDHKQLRTMASKTTDAMTGRYPPPITGQYPLSVILYWWWRVGGNPTRFSLPGIDPAIFRIRGNHQLPMRPLRVWCTYLHILVCKLHMCLLIYSYVNNAFVELYETVVSPYLLIEFNALHSKHIGTISKLRDFFLMHDEQKKGKRSLIAIFKVLVEQKI